MSFDRRITPAREDLADERLRGTLKAERYASGTRRRVIAPSVSLRPHPSPEVSIDTEALMGEEITIYDEHEGWAWGQLAADGYVGYLSAEALGALDAKPTHKVSALRTFIYPGPGLKLPPLAHVSLGATLAVAGSVETYGRLAKGGFVFLDHLREIDSREPDFVAVAERFVGTPYLWGGKTSLGLDCSGLVQLALGAAGVAAPRDTDLQEKTLGEPLALDANLSGLERGDLVFWKGHVGIMLDGARLLHANGHHMATAAEPLAVAEQRIREKTFGPITSIRRLAPT